MKTFIKLTVVVTIFATIFSCSVPKDDVNSINNEQSQYVKEKDSRLVISTEKYFDEIIENVNSEQDREYIELKTNELLREYAIVMESENGMEEAETAIKYLNEIYGEKSLQKDPCSDGFRSCAFKALLTLVSHVMGGGDQTTGIMNAYISILHCVGAYTDCVFN